MELGVSHVQNLSSLTPIVDNIFDKYNNKNLVPIRSLSDHDITIFLPEDGHSKRSLCPTVPKAHFTKVTLIQ